MLDAIGHDPATGSWYVQPSAGRRADWVRNAMARPAVTVEVRGQRFRARVEDVTGEEGAGVVLRFFREHPRCARVIVWFVRFVDSIDVPDEELRRALLGIPVFALRPVE